MIRLLYVIMRTTSEFQQHRPLEGAAAFARGAPADFVVFPDARSISELFSRPQADRVVLRRGRVQASVLPAYMVPSVVVPIGRLNFAEVPVASVVPEVPAVPARVVTTPVEITTLRIVWLKTSTT